MQDLLRDDKNFRPKERNTHSIAAEEVEMHRIFSLILIELAVQILVRSKSAKDYRFRCQNLYILIIETTKTHMK